MLVFPESAPEKLGLQIVLEDVASHLVSDVGREKLGHERPGGKPDEIGLRLSLVAEMQQVLRFDDPLVWTELPDARSTVARVRPQGSLVDGEELLEVSSFLAAVRRVRTYFAGRGDRYPEITTQLSALGEFREIEKSISGAIGRDGSVVDGASSELQRIRRTLAVRERDLRKALNDELRSAVASGYATEDQPTIRNGRMVIPVRAEAKRKIRGFIQDASSTGQTVYIEPATCLELNNELRELEAEESREIRRILISIADGIRRQLADVETAIELLGRFDVIQAKARTGNRLDGIVPRLNDGERLYIVEGRNPALVLRFGEDGAANTSRTVVPLTLDLSGEARTVLITGPNAGGKTVALGTVGLFVLMLGYGIPIPADETTDIPLFKKILVDIGDEQSIEHDLSTFSSHLRNLTRMMGEADERTLVLIDEAGTGTDPDEGAALAQSALERLASAGAWTIATTHHGRLKAFAHEHPRVRNGAMEFDRKSLIPTYRFRIDVPGSSYAFEIGRRMGFPPDLLDRARELTGERKAVLEDLISDYEARVAEATAIRDSLLRERQDVETAREKYESQSERMRAESTQSREEALRRADRLLRDANARIERTIREIRESQADREATRRARRRLEAFRDEIEEQIEDIEEETRERAEEGGASIAELRVGDQVVLDEGSVRAEIAEIDQTHAVIVNRAVRLRVALERLTRVGGKSPQRVEIRQSPVVSGGLPSQAVSQRIDLRGKRVEEALREVGRFIDVAIPSSLKTLEILHGKGTGALRSAIWEYLESRPEIAAFEEADIEQGGAGVTIIHLQ
jgi:DNA mismatch repair protein MutS2